MIGDVRWDNPAFNAGLGSGTTVVAVSGQAYGKDVLDDAVKAAKDGKAPIELLVKEFDRFRTVSSTTVAACATRTWSAFPASRHPLRDLRPTQVTGHAGVADARRLARIQPAHGNLKTGLTRPALA